MTTRKPTATKSKAEEELAAAFAAEGITVRDLVRTLNAVRTGANRYSTKTGEIVDADHQARGKAATDLLELLGLPEKRKARDPEPPAPPRTVAGALAERQSGIAEDPLA